MNQTPDTSNGFEKNCKLCSHFFVCDIVKVNARALGSEYEPNRKPFSAVDLAKICKFFELATSEQTKQLLRQ